MPGSEKVPIRTQLVTFLRNTLLDPNLDIRDETSLIRSGLLDSSALFNLTLWIEEHAISPVDPASFDLSREWDTIAGILNFIDKQQNKS